MRKKAAEVNSAAFYITFEVPIYGAQRPAPLQFVVFGQPAFGTFPQDDGFWHAHDAAANALCGATSEAITGIATIEASPIFLMTSRREVPSKPEASCFSRRLFSLN